jgi:hypothetical protein
MKKMKTLFVKNDETYLVSDEVDPDCAWVYDGNAVATRKYDGAACCIIEGRLYKRYDSKNSKRVPERAIRCMDYPVNGHMTYWVPCDRENPGDRWFFEAFDALTWGDGTYECIGERINGNPERVKGHRLIMHGCHTYGVKELADFTYCSIISFVKAHDIEGIVFHETVAPYRMCKIRKKDFGFKRGAA